MPFLGLQIHEAEVLKSKRRIVFESEIGETALENKTSTADLKIISTRIVFHS